MLENSRILTDREEIMNSASKYLRSNISIFLDSSSTCMYIIPAAAEFEGITLITNSIQNLLFAEKYHIKCIIAGGDYYERDMCTTGSHTENFLRGINTDVSFFSVQGLSDDGIISDNDENQSAIRKIVMKNSKKNIFFFDESKLGAKYLYTVCCADETDEIIILKAH